MSSITRHGQQEMTVAGTLTQNRMTVVEGWFAGTKYATPPSASQLSDTIRQELVNNICLNSKAFYIEEAGKKVEFVGNRTDCALLLLCQRDWSTPYSEVRAENAHRIKQLYGFSSAKKMASVLVDLGNGTLRLYNKGASEWVLEKAVAMCNHDGTTKRMTPERKQELLDIVTEMASKGLRTLVRSTQTVISCGNIRGSGFVYKASK